MPYTVGLPTRRLDSPTPKQMGSSPMNRCLSRIVAFAGLLTGLALFAQPERPGVAEAIAQLKTAPVEELLAVCNQVIVPEQRAEADDTKERMVIYGLAMQAGSDPALKQRLETAFCAQLAADKPAAIKTFFLGQLIPLASPACVASVAPLLPDPALCDLAARTLLTVGNDEAKTALRAALPQSAGAAQLTLVQALGELADDASVPALLELAKAEDRELRLAAGKALAATGDPRAADVLRAATTDPSRYNRGQADESYLRFLRQLGAKGEKATATGLALDFAKARNQDAQIQCGVIEVCALTGEPAGVDFVVNGLLSPEKRVRDSAARSLRLLPTATVTPRLVALLDQAPAVQQADVLLVLGRMQAAGALPAVKARLASPEESVRQAAIASLGLLAGKDAVADLTALLAGPDAAAAQAALVAIPDPAVGAALVAQAKTAPAKQAELLLAIVAQRLDQQAPAVLALASHPESETRLAALQALTVLATPAEIAGLADRVIKAEDKKERSAATKALIAVCKRTTDPAQCAPIVLAALQGATGDPANALLTVLPAIGDATCLAAATAALQAPSDDTKREAVKALGDWPTPAALPALREVAAQDQDVSRYVFAFRGMVRLIGQLPLPTDQLIGQYDEAVALARRPDEKRLVLGGLGKLRDRAALPKLLGYLADPELVDEAGVATLELARTVKGDDAVKALRDVITKVKNPDVLKRAKDVLNEITEFAGCVGVWEVSGPYTKDDKGHTALYPIVFPPEDREAKDVVWRKVEADRNDGHLNLIPLCGETNRCAYMRVNLLVPKQTPALLEIGSDDGLKVWLNGNVCHEMNVPRAYVPNEDKFPVTLLEGTNTLLLKITQGGGGWEANARIRAADGTPVEGLNFEIGAPVYREAVAVKLADGAPTAEQLGWRMSIQCWSFRNFTFFQSVDKAQRMGVKCLEMFPGQTVDPTFGDVKTNQDMSPEVQQAIQAKLAEAGIQIVNFGVTGVPGDEAGRRKLFAWAKSMGIETICCEPDPKDLPGLDPFCQEYGINLALHNHPKPSRYWDPQTVLDACQGLSPRIGACADTGHWMRSGIQPLEAVKLLKGRLVTFHFKDLDKVGDGAHDVPWGTGQGDLIEVLRELKRQGVKAAFSSEYEYNWDNNEVDIAACVRNFEAMARQIILEEDGKWQVLFTMRDLDAFMAADGKAPAAGWRIMGDELAMTGKGGDIWTRARFGNFVLDLEFKTTGNSGLFFRTDNPRDPVQTGIEMQVERPGGPNRHSVSAFYDLQAPSQNAANGDWNHVTLTAKDNLLTIVLNGVTVNQMDLDQWATPGQNPDGSANKFAKALKDFKREGHIGFQDHGNPVRYRYIRIQPID